MSPEQLDGREADARSDVFALGAVIYEMATGVPPFGGKSPASVIASILASDPPAMTAAAPASPPALERLVRACLAKDPEDRWQSAHDLRLELEAIRDASPDAAVGAPVRSRFELMAWPLTLLIAALGGVWLGVRYVGREPPETARYYISPPADTNFEYAVVSPNGKMLAFVGTSKAYGTAQLWTKTVDALTAQPLAGTDGIRPGGAAMSGVVFWSPDSQSIGFFANGSLKVIDAHGGPPQALCPAAGQNSGTWSTDGTILFGLSEAVADNGLYRVPAAGGTPQAVHLTDESGHSVLGAFWPRFLPDGRHFLFLSHTSASETRTLRAGTLGDAATTAVMPLESRVEYAPPGYLLWVRDGTLLAQPFDAARQRLSGRATAVGQGVRSFPATGNANFSVSDTGLLVYERQQTHRTQLVRVDRAGRETDALGEPLDMDMGTLSPSGSQLAFSAIDPHSGIEEVWTEDLDRKLRMRFTFGPGAGSSAFDPIWSVDGSHIVFSADWGGVPHLFLQAIGASQATTLLAATGNVQMATAWSDAARVILFMERSPTNDFDVWALPLVGDRKPRPVVATKFYEGEAVLSPDGRWLAHTSDESGERNVYVQAFPGSGERTRVSTDGGSLPQWRRDGKELFYAAGGTLMSVAVVPGDRLSLAAPLALFGLPDANFAYLAFADGQHFIEGRATQVDDSRLPIVVVNWSQGMAR
jgi:Tol biopolymer transport system component